MKSASEIIEMLVTEEIDRIIAEALDTAIALSVPAEAERIVKTYSNVGLSEKNIARQIIMAAIAAGAGVEIEGTRIAHPLDSLSGSEDILSTR
jgi:hypothetical protein